MAKKRTDVYIMGDVHRDFGTMSKWVQEHEPKIVLQCGDFGYWPNTPDMTGPAPGTRPGPVPDVGTTQLFFCDGNHEDHRALLSLEDLRVYPNIYYMQRGMTLKLQDGRVVLFVGGARSIDAHLRILGRDWFEEEELTPRDLGFLEDMHVDIVVSHTCPLDFNIQDERDHGADPSRIVLSLILERFRPDHWFFGHYHMYETGRAKGCWWTALPKIGDEMWCVPLPPPRRRRKKR